MAKVLKPFKSQLHRFAVGDEVNASHDLTPLSLESLVEGGFVTDADKPSTFEMPSVTISHGDDEA